MSTYLRPCAPKLLFLPLTALLLSCGTSECVSGPECDLEAVLTPTTIDAVTTPIAFDRLGATQRIAATVRDQNRDVLAGVAIDWSTSDASVATVDGDGVVTAVGNGTAQISARSGSLSASVQVTVRQVPTEVTIEPDPILLPGVGSSLQLGFTALDGGGSEVVAATATWSSSDPSVVSVDADGVVTAEAEGEATITLEARVGAGSSATGTAQVRVVAPLVIETTVLPDATTGEPYAASVSASNGGGGYVWSVTGGALPEGLLLNPATGGIAGTTIAEGTHAFTVAVTSADGQSTSQALTILVWQGLTILTVDLPDGRQNTPYSLYLQASGGDGVYEWSTAPGTMPEGLSLDPSTGEINGTPTGSGTSAFPVEVTSGDGQSASTELSITIVLAFAITTTELPDGTVGDAYEFGLETIGGTGPFTWELANGDLPVGISLGADDGMLTGTPTSTGESSFSVLVHSADGQAFERVFSITVTSDFVVVTSSLPPAAFDLGYAVPLEAAGGELPYAWEVTAGALPDGLELDGTTGEIAGTSTAVGVSTFTVQVMSADGQTASRELSIEVAAQLVFRTRGLASGVVGVRYDDVVVAAGGVPPFDWSIVDGSLPAGVVLDDANDGAIGGTPIAAGLSSFTIQLTSGDGQTLQGVYSIEVFEPLVVTTTGLPGGSVGVDYESSVAATGGGGGHTWSVTAGTLPDGLELAHVTGTISGTPTTAGTSTFTVEALSGDGQTADRELSITIVGALAITTDLLAPGTIGAAYSETVEVTGGDGDYSFEVSVGALPSGLDIDDTTGEISGTPAEPGGTTFTIQVTSGDGQVAAREFRIFVIVPLEITTTSLADGTVDVDYFDILEATGGGGGYVWSVSDGTLPDGLDLDAGNGEITGSPTTAGTSTFTIEVAGEDGQVTDREFTIQIIPLLVITTTSLPDGTLDVDYLAPLTATGGAGGYTWGLFSGSLPFGLDLDPATGEISGTPGEPQTSSFTVVVTSDDEQSTTRALSITISSPQPAVYCDNGSGPPCTTTVVAVPDFAGVPCLVDPTTGNCPTPGQIHYGQDASYSINPDAFTLIGRAERLEEAVSGLSWTIAAMLADSYDEAVSTCAVLATEGFSNRTDWRVPSLREVSRALSRGLLLRVWPSPIANPPNSAWWTSDASKVAPSHQIAIAGNWPWTRTMPADGSTGPFEGARHVTCVSGAQMQGAWIANADGVTVTHTTTGLMWHRDASASQTMEWDAALSYCETSSVGGHTNWRLPSLREYVSVFDMDTPNGYMSDAFGTEPTGKMFTSTVVVASGDGDIAWVNESTGVLLQESTATLSGGARCVR